MTGGETEFSLLQQFSQPAGALFEGALLEVVRSSR
jgi:hypothetical protein